jgi:predicted enzyme related to lactoylglutathione lyase
MKFGIMMLYVHDLPKARAFYENVVGLPVVPEQSDEHFTVFRPSEGTLIALEDVSVVKNPISKPGSFELGLEVEDVDATFQQWKAHQVEIVDEPADMPFGRAFLARDPEGHYITVYRLNQAF